MPSENKYFNLYLAAAKKLGIEFTYLIPDEPIGYFHKSNKKLYIFRNIIGLNNSASNLFSNIKHIAYQILGNKNYPVPNAILFDKEKAPKKIVEETNSKLTKPFVVKPYKGSGGLGVSVKVENTREFEKAIEVVVNLHKHIIVEEYTEGFDYRIIVYKGKILDIIQRIPANVTGNGKDPISTLINSKNNSREKHNLQPIPVDNELTKTLEQKQLALETILEERKNVVIRQNCNMNTGGETKRIKIEDTHPDNIELFKNVTKLMGLNFSGIDYISKDISKSYKDIRTIINEINRAPQLGANYFADMKLDNFISEEILAIYFDIKQ